jgi:4-hydroxybenzoyl-CoA thioesterase
MPRRPGRLWRTRSPAREELAIPAFTFTTPVRFADVDHAGIIYYPRFFHLFHIAFEELWRARMGARAYSALIDREHVGFPAVHAECDFKSPLRFGDEAEIAVSVERLGERSITFRYRVHRVAPRALAAEGKVVCAVVDLARFVAISVPEHVVNMLRDLQEEP